MNGENPPRDPRAPTGSSSSSSAGESRGPTPGFGAVYEGDPKFRQPIVEVLKTVFDPEIPVDIYELGLVYRIEVSEEGRARIELTLTSPACPAAEIIPREVQSKVGAIEGITEAHVDVVWDPPWSMEFMSEEARLALGMY